MTVRAGNHLPFRVDVVHRISNKQGYSIERY